MPGTARFDFYPSDFLNGCIGLSAEEIAVYTIIMAMHYDHGEPIPFVDRQHELQVRTGLTRAKLGKVVRKLVDLGKLTWFGNAIGNARTAKELEKIEQKLSENRQNSAKGGAKTREKWQELSNKNNGDGGPDGPAGGVPPPGPNLLPSPTSNIGGVGNARASQDQFSKVENLCRDAADLTTSPAPRLFDVSPIMGLIRGGADLESEILPAIRAKPNPDARCWDYFVPQIQRFRANLHAPADVVPLHGARPPPKQNPWIEASARIAARGKGNGYEHQPDDDATTTIELSTERMGDADCEPSQSRGVRS